MLTCQFPITETGYSDEDESGNDDNDTGANSLTNSPEMLLAKVSQAFRINRNLHNELSRSISNHNPTAVTLLFLIFPNFQPFIIYYDIWSKNAVKSALGILLNFSGEIFSKILFSMWPS